MNIFEIICGAILVLVALAIIVLTGAQENKGSSDTMSAGRSRSNDAKMAKLTKICGIVFVAVTLLVSVLSVRLG